MFYLKLAIIIILAKVCSDLSGRIKQPPVLGLLLMGIFLGPSITGLIQLNEIIKALGEIGVFILLFMAGMETDIQKMRREGMVTMITAALGVALPFFVGFLLCYLWGFSLMKGLLIGTILTATSVSVTVMTLWDMKRLDSLEGRVILGAAIVDDVFGILVLTLILAIFAKSGPSVTLSVLKMLLFFGAGCVMAFFIGPVMYYAERLKAEKSTTAVAFGVMCLFAWLAQLCQLATITGTYLAGLIIGLTTMKSKVLNEINTIGQAIFIPLFFVNIGLEAQIGSIKGYILFGVFLISCAIVAKMVGAGIGAWIAGRLTFRQSLRIGLGMIPRAEVALAIASIGLSRGIITRTDFSIVVLLCLTTAIITPLLLRASFAGE